jgi:hypothetical protein
LIHQGRLADIRRARNRNHEPVTQSLASSLGCQHSVDLAQQRFNFRKRRRDHFGGHIAFIGEIDPGFDQRLRLDDPGTPIARAIAQEALQLAQRLTALPFCVGVNEIVEAFGFREVELSILEGTSGKLTGFGGTHVVNRSESRKERGKHRAASMNMKLGDVFARRTSRSWKPQDHGIVDRMRPSIPQQGTRRTPWRRHFPGQQLQCDSGQRPGDADNRNRARWPAGGQSEDGLVIGLHQSLFVPLPLERQRSFAFARAEDQRALRKR